MLAADTTAYAATAEGGDERLPASGERHVYCADVARAGQRHMAGPDRPPAGPGVGLLRHDGPGAGLYRPLRARGRAEERYGPCSRIRFLETGDRRQEID